MEYINLIHKYIDAISVWKRGNTVSPPWVGLFWNDRTTDPAFSSQLSSTSKLGKDTQPKMDFDRSGLVQCIRSLPTRNAVEEASAFRPEAKELLEKWRETWLRSFPGFDENQDLVLLNESSTKNEVERWNHAWLIHAADHDVECHDTLREYMQFLQGEDIDPEDFEDVASLSIKSLSEIDRRKDEFTDDKRDYRLHIIEDAALTMSFAGLNPRGGVLLFQRSYEFEYVGTDLDGFPRFVRNKHVSRWARGRLDSTPAYWTWESFQKYLNRGSILLQDISVGGAMLADMAWQGHQKAFIKSTRRKGGTWTVDLSNIRSLDDGKIALYKIFKTEALDDPFLIQEHLPFTHEQRFFITNGRVIGSVCSDRNLSPLDTRNGRRLDDRLAVLNCPEVEDGVFDRGITTYEVNRTASARLAKLARKIARELKEEGHLEYVLDLGLTRKGDAAVEVNTLHYAGPYCFDYNWKSNAYKKMNDVHIQKMRSQLAKFAMTASIAPDVVETVFQHGDAIENRALGTLPHRETIDQKSRTRLNEDVLDILLNIEACDQDFEDEMRPINQNLFSRALIGGLIINAVKNDKVRGFKI